MAKNEGFINLTDAIYNSLLLVRMTKPSRYDRDLLNTIMTRDEATLVGEYDKVNRESKINFICKCGTENIKSFRRSEVCGMLCKSCTEKKKTQS
jgi:hypothetical protein